MIAGLIFSIIALILFLIGLIAIMIYTYSGTENGGQSWPWIFLVIGLIMGIISPFVSVKYSLSDPDTLSSPEYSSVPSEPYS